jgi:hypothetical protein
MKRQRANPLPEAQPGRLSLAYELDAPFQITIPNALGFQQDFDAHLLRLSLQAVACPNHAKLGAAASVLHLHNISHAQTASQAVQKCAFRADVGG